jgi:hypothetical protein
MASDRHPLPFPKVTRRQRVGGRRELSLGLIEEQLRAHESFSGTRDGVADPQAGMIGPHPLTRHTEMKNPFSRSCFLYFEIGLSVHVLRNCVPAACSCWKRRDVFSPPV